MNETGYHENSVRQTDEILGDLNGKPLRVTDDGWTSIWSDFTNSETRIDKVESLLTSSFYHVDIFDELAPATPDTFEDARNPSSVNDAFLLQGMNESYFRVYEVSAQVYESYTLTTGYVDWSIRNVNSGEIRFLRRGHVNKKTNVNRFEKIVGVEFVGLASVF